MLTLTDNARAAVQDIAERAGLPEQGGLRIAPSPAQDGSFELSLVAEAPAGDSVIDAERAKVYLEPETSAVLADQQLDAVQSEAGPGFLLAHQG